MLLVVFAALAAFNLQALPGEGAFVVFDESGQGLITFDAARIERDGDMRRVPVIALSGPDAGVGRAFALYPYQIDCRNRRFRVERFAIFNEDLSFDQDHPTSEPDWDAVSPNAPIAQVFGQVCEGKNLPTRGTDLRVLSQDYWRARGVEGETPRSPDDRQA